MDANKLVKLREIGFKINRVCGLCAHGEFPSPASPWGTCKIQSYDHLKHSDSARQLSVHRAGSCDKMEPDATRFGRELGSFAEFFE